MVVVEVYAIEAPREISSGMLEVPVDLNDLLSTTKVECVQRLEADKLKTLLQWIVDCLQKQKEEGEHIKQTETLLEEQAKTIEDIRHRLEKPETKEESPLVEFLKLLWLRAGSLCF